MEWDRTQRIAALLQPPQHRAQVSGVLADLFPGTATDSANKALSRLLNRVNEQAEELGIDLRMRITEARSVGAQGRFVWFEGDAAPEVTHTTPELEQVQDRLIEAPRGQPMPTEPRIALTRGADGKPVVRWFLSYAHKDDAKDAADLRRRLDVRLKNSARYRFEGWHDSLLLAGHRWREEIGRALETSHLGVLAVSNAFLASDFITTEELPAFVSGTAEGVPGKRAVPVMLKAVDLTGNTDLKGLAGHQIFRDGEGKAFVERAGHKRDAWVDALFDQLCALLGRHADMEPGAPPAQTMATSRHAPERQRRPLPDFASADMLSGDLLDAERCLIETTQGRAAALDQRLLEAPRPAAEDAGVDVMAYLLDWLREPGAPPLFALLGEYGMGKTITCQRLVRRIEAERRDAPPGAAPPLPQPLYFDLRKLTGLRQRAHPPTLPEIVDECIARGWRLGGGDKPTAQALIERAAAHDLLSIFDGLDEALVHLSEVDGQVFTRELLRVQPPRRGAAPARRRHARADLVPDGARAWSRQAAMAASASGTLKTAACSASTRAPMPSGSPTRRASSKPARAPGAGWSGSVSTRRAA